MFGEVDESRDHSVITVNSPVKIMPLRRAVLPEGVYKIQGDVRGKLGHIRVRRLIAAGIFSVQFVQGTDKGRKVFARTQTVPAQVAPTPAPPEAQKQAKKTLPGVEARLGRREVEKPSKQASRPTITPEPGSIKTPQAIEADYTVFDNEHDYSEAVVVTGINGDHEEEDGIIDLGNLTQDEPVAEVEELPFGEDFADLGDLTTEDEEVADLGDLTQDDYEPDTQVIDETSETEDADEVPQPRKRTRVRERSK